MRQERPPLPHNSGIPAVPLESKGAVEEVGMHLRMKSGRPVSEAENVRHCDAEQQEETEKEGVRAGEQQPTSACAIPPLCQTLAQGLANLRERFFKRVSRNLSHASCRYRIGTLLRLQLRTMLVCAGSAGLAAGRGRA